MMRQASGRNQRSKVFIVKNVLQVCILVVVFLWLLYQTKLSYDKNKALHENNSRILNDVAGSHSDVFKLARKGLSNVKVPASAGDKTPVNLGENGEAEEEEKYQEVRRAMENAQVTADDDGINDQDHEREDEEDEQESISEDDKDDQAEEAERIIEDHEHEEDPSQERHEKIYMGDDASSAVLHVNQRTGADDKNTSVLDKDMEPNDRIDKRDDDSKYSNHDVIATSVIAVRNENNQSNSSTLIGATVDKTREGHSPVDDKPKQQVNSTVISKSHDSVRMQTGSLIVAPSNETTGNVSPIMNSVEGPNSLKSMVEEQLVTRNTTAEQDHQLQKADRSINRS